MVLEKGSKYEIEAALDKTGSPEAIRYLENLADEARISVASAQNTLADLALQLQDFADGKPQDIPRQVNDLRDGIQEIKVGKLRLPFYLREDASCGHVRLTHGFWKRGNDTPNREIDKAKAIRRTDMERDEPV